MDARWEGVGVCATGSTIGPRQQYIVTVDQPNNVRPVVKDEFNQLSPEFSRDGRWLAYCSTKSNRSELYVQAYPGPGKPVPVSTDGASEPAWSRNSNELFYRTGRKMMAVRFKVEGTEFLPEKPVQLFEGDFATANPRSYDVAADGRFLMIRPIPDTENKWNKAVYPSTLRIVLNWTDELHRLMAQAIVDKLTLITSDSIFERYPGLDVKLM